MNMVDVPSSLCFPHPCSSLSDDLGEVMCDHDAEVQSDVVCVRFFNVLKNLW